MADEQDKNPAPDASGAGMPPKQGPFKPVQPSEGPATLRRPVLRRPGEQAPPGQPAPPSGLPPTPGVRKDTSRIPLPTNPSATAPIAPQAGLGDVKTVKVKPAGPMAGQPPAPAAPPLTAAPDVPTSKSKTSRISLEAALGAVGEAPAAASAPKTIRLKRPTDLPPGRITSAIPVSATAHIGGMAPTATAPIPNVGGGGPAMGQTARLPTSKLATQRIADELPGEGGESSSLTRRKTIKVKRPSAAGGLKVQREEAPAAAEGAATPGDEGIQMMAIPGAMRGVVTADTAHWSFIFISVVNVLVAIGLIWILAAQAFGPNAAITGYARAQGPNLPSPVGGTVE